MTLVDKHWLCTLLNHQCLLNVKYFCTHKHSDREDDDEIGHDGHNVPRAKAEIMSAFLLASFFVHDALLTTSVTGRVCLQTETQIVEKKEIC